MNDGPADACSHFHVSRVIRRVYTPLLLLAIAGAVGWLSIAFDKFAPLIATAILLKGAHAVRRSRCNCGAAAVGEESPG